MKRIGKREKKIKPKFMPYILQFIDSTRFVASSLSNLVANLSEGIRGTKCEYSHDNEKIRMQN